MAPISLASTWGGLRRLGAGLALAGKEPPPCACLLVWCCISSGRLRAPAPRSFCGALIARRSRPSSRHGSSFANAAAMFVAGCEAGNAAQVLAAVRQAAKGYRQLGTVLGCPLLTDEHAEIAATAARLGGAAKPSGAGRRSRGRATPRRGSRPALRCRAAAPCGSCRYRSAIAASMRCPRSVPIPRASRSSAEGSRLPLSTIEHPNDSSRGA